MDELSAQYNPAETEDKWYKFWEENSLFSAKPDPDKKPFCIVIPPPNVTGILHMGHALNNTIQDILIRWHRMKGEVSLWMPGTDHAGIATQNVVEKTLAKEGLKRQDLGREKFIQRVWLWKEQYGSTIIRQLKKIGASCDWQRERFTMDAEYSKAVSEVFVRLYEKGLIYRGSYIINWCPRCQTALSDEEAPHKEVNGFLYYIRYPFEAHPDKFIVVATTRPETMLGDTAVAVNPKDKRYKKLIGETLILPLVNRKIRLIADNAVDMKFGTGAVKVTPSHDPNDYALAKKHNLDFINVMHPDGRMNENAGSYFGLDRFEAREVIVEDLKEKSFLEKIEPHKLSAGHCYRCHTVIEPYLSRQWFVKMKPLAKPASEAVKKGRIKFHPERWMKVYLNWMENIQDWCISRQIWWGHRLPVYYCNDCQEQANEGIIVSRIKPDKCPTCGSTDIYQDEDVLDTWFSSWLWPFATFYWPFYQPSAISHQLSAEELEAESRNLKADLDYFYPTSVLVTAPEIIFFWVARMIMAGVEFMGDIPFKDVYIHGTVRDIEGKKMSKSLGNIIDPLDIINEYGADALRFSLILITASGQDVFLSKERFQQGRNFANKIWNASRFILMNLSPGVVKTELCVFFKKENLDSANRWILSKFYSTLKKINKALDAFQFNEAASMLYGFFWHDFCDWYLEIIKPDIRNYRNQVVMYKVLEKFLRVLHPFMPFISEEIWQKLQGLTPSFDFAQDKQGAVPVTSIMVQPWPHIQEQIIDKKAEDKMLIVFEVITALRNMRQELDIPAQKSINALLSSQDKETLRLINDAAGHIKHLCRIENLSIQEKYSHIKSSINSVIKDIHITLPLAGIVDAQNEKIKFQGRIRELESQIRAKEKTLNNREFLKKAPLEVAEKEKMRLSELEDTLKRLKVIVDALR